MEAIAVCKWFWRDTHQHKWVEVEGSEECRASIGKKVVTIWLPRGAKIRCRMKRIDPKPFGDILYHHYGEAFPNKIEIRLKPIEG